jgi:hypothetical protein
MIETTHEFVRLRSSENPEEYRRASSDPAFEATWREVVTSYPEMAFWVVQNKTVPHSILELLADHVDPRIRSAVARKRKLTYTMFEHLSCDEDESVRLAIALNKKTPPKIVTKLVNDDSLLVADTDRKSLNA